jgi:hypothetical protein
MNASRIPPDWSILQPSLNVSSSGVNLSSIRRCLLRCGTRPAGRRLLRYRCPPLVGAMRLYLALSLVRAGPAPVPRTLPVITQAATTLLGNCTMMAAAWWIAGKPIAQSVRWYLLMPVLTVICTVIVSWLGFFGSLKFRVGTQVGDGWLFICYWYLPKLPSPAGLPRRSQCLWSGVAATGIGPALALWSCFVTCLISLW